MKKHFDEFFIYVRDRNARNIHRCTCGSPVFGGKKIPELMKGIGKGVKGFKGGINGIEKDIITATTSRKKL